MVLFTRPEKALLFESLIIVIRQVRGMIRVFTPITSLRTLVDQHAHGIEPEHPCRGGADFFFVDARDGNAYPCGYRGSENLGPFWKLDLSGPVLAPSCTACNWECFRDASELHGAISSAVISPLSFGIDRILGRRASVELSADVHYALACDAFHGRKAPIYNRMEAFGENRNLFLYSMGSRSSAQIISPPSPAGRHA
jgi:hypothetical protein